MGDLEERVKVKYQVVNCTLCGLHEVATPVPFTGQPRSLTVTGEAPGREEDKQGKPFVGPSGRVLRRGLEKVGIDPLSVAFMNAVSCCPDGTPTKAQVNSCRGNMERQIDYLDPPWVLVLGNTALNTFWPGLRIGEMRGKWWWEEDRSGGKRWLTPTYHPSAVLRDRNLWDQFLGDLQELKFFMSGGGMFWGEEDEVGDPDGECVKGCGKKAVRWKRGIGACNGHKGVLRYGRDKVSLF